MAGRFDLELTVRGLDTLGPWEHTGTPAGRREWAGNSSASGTSGSQTQAQALTGSSDGESCWLLQTRLVGTGIREIDRQTDRQRDSSQGQP